MTSSKEQFCGHKQLAEWWGTVVANPMFDEVMLHARAVALEQTPDAAQRDGALHFGEILSTLHQPGGQAQHFPKPGLRHGLPERKLTDKTKKK